MQKDRLITIREWLGGIGLLLFASGLALWSIPLALTTVGALLFGLAVWPYIAPQRGDE
jgi:hypothetical protein